MGGTAPALTTNDPHFVESGIRLAHSSASRKSKGRMMTTVIVAIDAASCCDRWRRWAPAAGWTTAHLHRRRPVQSCTTCRTTRARCKGYPLADESYGTRSQFETDVRTRFKTARRYRPGRSTPLAGQHADRHAVGPALRAQSWRHRRDRSGASIRSTCMAWCAQPKKFSMRTSGASRRCRGLHVPRMLGQWTDGMVEADDDARCRARMDSRRRPNGPAFRWRRSSTKSGVRPGAKWLLAEGGDGAAMTRSIPIDKAMKDCLLATARTAKRFGPSRAIRCG